MEIWQTIARYIEETTDTPFKPCPPVGIGGGCIKTTVKLTDGQRSYFVKLNSAHMLGMFSAEAEGLGEIARSETLRVPQPICHGSIGNQAYLVLEHIQIGQASADAAERAGQQLAAMHRTTRQQFGWHRENTIGSTRQINQYSEDWIGFWRDHRLGFQLRLAKENGFHVGLQSQGEKLMEQLPNLLDHAPQASLLHGDLWGGNLAYDAEGEPFIYDPAVYYGDREADLAMTELFGGFPDRFYAAYQEAWPLDPGYRVRKTLYNLYHILNHANLFGGGYAGQAMAMIERLLAQT